MIGQGGPFGGRSLLVDKSAWEHLRARAVASASEQALRSGRLALSSITKLEILYSSRSIADLDRLALGLDQLRHVPIDEGVFRQARAAMRELATRASHRVPVVDYLVAASAAQRSLDVLHYDRHFDLLAEAMAFESVWIAPPGSL